MPYKPRKRTIPKTCLNCNKNFLVETGKKDAKYCSASCSHQHFSLLRSTEVECAQCFVKFSIKNSSLKRSKSGLYFCSMKHKALAQRIGGIEAIQPKHYGTGTSQYREKAFSNLPHKCHVCGYSKIIGVLVVHHKNRNRSDSSLQNLVILCPTCHMEDHYIQHDGLFS